MTAWTTTPPSESGFYWWRDPDNEYCGEPMVIYWSQELGTASLAGSEIMLWKESASEWDTRLYGQFWPVRLTPPNL